MLEQLIRFTSIENNLDIMAPINSNTNATRTTEIVIRFLTDVIEPHQFYDCCNIATKSNNSATLLNLQSTREQ